MQVTGGIQHKDKVDDKLTTAGVKEPLVNELNCVVN